MFSEKNTVSQYFPNLGQCETFAKFEFDLELLVKNIDFDRSIVF